MFSLDFGLNEKDLKVLKDIQEKTLEIQSLEEDKEKKAGEFRLAQRRKSARDEEQRLKRREEVYNRVKKESMESEAELQSIVQDIEKLESMSSEDISHRVAQDLTEKLIEKREEKDDKEKDFAGRAIQIENLEKSIRDNRERLENIEEAVANREKEFTQIVEQKDKNIEEISKDIEKSCSTLDEKIVARFIDLAKRSKGLVLAEVIKSKDFEKGVVFLCNACNSALPTLCLEELVASGSICVCPNCGRWMHEIVKKSRKPKDHEPYPSKDGGYENHCWKCKKGVVDKEAAAGKDFNKRCKTCNWLQCDNEKCKDELGRKACAHPKRCRGNKCGQLEEDCACKSFKPGCPDYEYK